MTALVKSRKSLRWSDGGGPPLLEMRDLSVALGLPLLLACAWVVPRSLWDPATRLMDAVAARLRPASRPGHETALTCLLGSRAGAGEIARIVCEAGRELRLAQLNALRLLRRGAATSRTRLVGREWLDKALDQGRGAILWVAPTACGPLVGKLALHEAGYPIVHLSRFSHGFSGSRWGARLANRLRTAVEDRYLARRVVIGADGAAVGATRLLAEALRSNGIVSISAGADGARTVTVPFLDGSVKLASGPISLARSTGAALLPVFAARDGDGSFVATIGAQVDPTDGAALYASWLEEHALRTPGQMVWHYDIFRLALAETA